MVDLDKDDMVSYDLLSLLMLIANGSRSYFLYFGDEAYFFLLFPHNFEVYSKSLGVVEHV